MPNPVAANDLQPISGSLQTSRVSYGVETAGKNYGQNYNSATWYSDIPNNGQFYTIISDNYTANYYVSRSNAEGAYVEGGLPAVDDYSAPVFWITPGTSSLDVITTVNGLPDRVGQVPFNSGSQALNWIASSSNYFAVGPDYYAQIDADNLGLYLDANQVISYPTTQSTWYDLSGNTKNGTLINSPTWNSNGYFVFDGVDDFISLGNVFAFERTDPFSVEFIIKAPVPSVYLPVINKLVWAAGAKGWRILSDFQGAGLDFRIADNHTVSDISINLPSVLNNKYRHVCFTYNGNGNTNGMNGFLDGSLNVSGGGGNLTTTTVSTTELGIFGGAGTNNTGLGELSVMKIYNRALSASDVAQNYYGGPIVTNNLSFMLDAGNLVSYPKSGTTAYDLTGNTNAALRNGTGFSSNDGGAWVLDGVDDFLELVSSITPGNGNWTLSAWVRGFGGVVGNTSGGPVASGFGIFSTGGNYKIFYANYDGVWNYNYGNTTLNPNEWYFLTWVNYDSQQMKMYVNGGADSSLFNSLTSNGGPVNAVGGTQGTPGGTFNGNIASVQWNIGTAFTDAQVLQNYNATK